MRGSPLFRALVAFGILLALAWPLSRLTRTKAVAQPATVRSSAPGKEATLQLTFTAAAHRIAVLHLGEEVWSDASRALEGTKVLKLAWPKEGVELDFRIEWPAGPPAAARVLLTAPDGEAHERTIWGAGPAQEVLTFP